MNRSSVVLSIMQGVSSENIGTLNFVSFIVSINVSNYSVNAQQTNHFRESISPVALSEIKTMIQLGLNMLVLFPLFAILNRRLAVTSRETYDCIMSLQNSSNRIHLTVRWVDFSSNQQRVCSIILHNT